MDGSQYLPFACELFHMECHSYCTTVLGQQTLNPPILRNAIDWVHGAFFCSDYTQQMWIPPEEVLCGCFVTTWNNACWNWVCTGGWRSWEWEWKLQHPHPSQQSTKSLPCFNHEGIILLSCRNWSITSYTRAPWRALTLRIQMLQLYKPPISVHQFRWWESCENQWMTLPTLQHQC